MIYVKFIGGAKKSFSSDQIQIDKSDISVQELIDLLLKMQHPSAPKLDTENILIAINGSDSSAMNGRSTKIKNNDLVSIIPLIHGGSSKKINFTILKKNIQIIEIRGQKRIDIKFLDILRTKYPKILLQAISSKFVLNPDHLKKVLTISLESERNNTLLSNKLETDILMRFALTKQISDAIREAGIKPKTNFILVAIGNKKILNSLYLDLESMAFNLFSKKNNTFLKQQFNITKKQLDSVYSKDALSDILVEKAAVLL